jgi:transposase
LYALAVPLRPYPLKTPQREQVDQLLGARRAIAQSLASLRQQRAELPYAAALLAGAIEDLKARLEGLDRELAELIEENELLAAGIKALDEVPGIGPVIATALASCLQGNQFEHPDQFVAYVGLDVRVRDSGQRRGQRALSKQGDSELRRLLYVAALASLRSRDRTFRQRYERELAKGLSRTAALCAVARKLARVCWSLLRHNATYDPNRVERQPISPIASAQLMLAP